MKILVPDYYPRFRCLAGACRHTCCAGWEIDIDPDSLARFRAVPGELGRRLRENIAEDPEGAHFRLTENERCPFLNQDNLCDLITALGEDSLCDICADHPRFRNFLSDRTETGLGLCCEAAALLILGWESPVTLLPLEDDGIPDKLWEEDRALLETRDALIAVAQNRALPINTRFRELNRMLDVFPEPRQPGERPVVLSEFPAFLSVPDISPAELQFLYRDLERLDPAWDAELDSLTSSREPLSDAWDVPFEQLLVYLLFRHVTGAAEDGDMEGRLAFSLLSWRVIRILAEVHNARSPLTLEALAELARLYSAEIEYSDENIARLIAALRSE